MPGVIVRSILLIVLTLAVTMLPASAIVGAQGDITVNILSVDDSEFPTVRMVVTADQAGVPITDLAPREVRIDESGAAARLTAVQLATDSSLPLALVVALDISGSMEEGGTLTRAKAAATSLINSLNPGDTAAVVSFSDVVTIEQSFTSDKALLTAAISRLQIAGATALYDAVAESARLAQSSGRQRRAVVILTDGEESGQASSLDRESSLATAANSAVLFYAVGVGFEADRDYLAELATRSRGRLFAAFGGAEIPSIYSSLADLLRSQIVITADSAAPSELDQRTARVSITRGSASGVAERPYTSLRPAAAPPPAPPPPPSGPTSSTPIAPIGVASLVVLAVLALALWRRRTRRAVAESEVEVENPPPTGEPVISLPSPERSPTRAILTVVEGPNGWKGRSFEVGEVPLTLGSRPSCAIRLPDEPGLAGEHVRVWARDGKVMLHHLARGATTSVRGTPITWASVTAGDEVAVGPYLIRCTSMNQTE